MKQSNSIQNRDNTIALYLRISREDKDADESYSIINQKKLLSKFAKEQLQAVARIGQAAEAEGA